MNASQKIDHSNADKLTFSSYSSFLLSYYYYYSYSYYYHYYSPSSFSTPFSFLFLFSVHYSFLLFLFFIIIPFLSFFSFLLLLLLRIFLLSYISFSPLTFLHLSFVLPYKSTLFAYSPSADSNVYMQGIFSRTVFFVSVLWNASTDVSTGIKKEPNEPPRLHALVNLDAWSISQLPH